ncbi:MAG: hypothetical protein OSB41_07360 [Kiritimatiellae bacterium]|nr:hypothetical protein [Kiritimatiellia bacterium]
MKRVLAFIMCRPLYWLAALILLSGVLANMRSRTASKTALDEMRQQAKWTETARVLVAEAESLRERRSVLAAMAAEPIVPIHSLLKASLSEFPPNDVRNLKTPAALGWSQQRKALSFQNVPLPALMRFVRIAEKTDPPWRLEEIRISASASKPGYASAVLEMSSISKK